MNSKLRKYIGAIIDIDDQEVLRKQSKFVTYHNDRVLYQVSLERQGLTGKAYSDKMVAYDKKFQQQSLFN